MTYHQLLAACGLYVMFCAWMTITFYMVDTTIKKAIIYGVMWTTFGSCFVTGVFFCIGVLVGAIR